MALPAQHEVLQGQIETAVVALRKGGVVAVPTDTLYGLAASVLDEPAVRRVFQLKGRPEGGAMPILLDDLDRVAMCAHEIPDVAWELMDRFWPGALTLVLHRSPQIPSTVSGGKNTVALRVPDHRVPRDIVVQLDAPITGTSANRSGEQGLTNAEAVRKEFGAELDLVIDGLAVAGLPSTVLDLTEERPSVLREGAVATSKIVEVLGTALASDD
jgi:L-threonylcarbamoyladenylate synthase